MTIDWEKEKIELERSVMKTINYLRDILENIIKITNKIHKINKSWVGIDRSSEMLIFRASKYLQPMQIMIEYVYFELTKEMNNNPEIKDSISDLYRKAIELWETPAQTLMVIEEMSELSVNLCHLLRGRITPTDTKGMNKVVEEIADVEIMIDQLKIMYNLELRVHNCKQCKLERLKNKLEGELDK